MKGRYGRIFDLTLTRERDAWKGRVNRTIKLPPPDTAATQDQEYSHNFEAIACFSTPDNQLVVVLGDCKRVYEKSVWPYNQ